MASTSSSAPPCKYDVFISFRGKDTRYGILSHLFEALQRKQINAFLDEELRKGEEISPALLKIIQESSVSIVIFSENYADSAWCLDELVEILKCREESGQIVLPVFYKVDPTEVQDLTGNFGKALAMHGEKGNSQKVDSWKRALMEVSNFAGWDLQEIKVDMHDLLEQMGKDIVNEECKQPGGRSRLWNYEDIDHVLTTDTGTENVEAISLRPCGRGILELSAKAFAKMCNLRFIQLDEMSNKVLLPKNFEFCAQALRCLYWDYYPLESLPLNFWPKNLVELQMPFNDLIQLWNRGDKPLGSLKLMDLSYSCNLIRIPDLSSIAPNVEILYLNECPSLVEIPSLQNLSKLTALFLTGPNKIKDCPEIPCNIRFLHLDCTGIEQLPSSIKHLSQLVILFLDWCTALESLPSSIGNLKRLEQLHLAECSRLVTIPSSIGELKCLEKLFLPNCSNLASLPESIKQLSKLKQLNFYGCERLKSLPGLPSCLELLDATDCCSLESASISFNFLEHDDENEEADRSEHENEETHKSESEDRKFLDF